ncbi:hypothetical protein F5Y07DRAFT_145405 [Xylaria sp. FL0933]|nr:hypothetical protein F5Y07DRAFT_145405 [Xylaria sp. FL0933]
MPSPASYYLSLSLVSPSTLPQHPQYSATRWTWRARSGRPMSSGPGAPRRSERPARLSAKFSYGHSASRGCCSPTSQRRTISWRAADFDKSSFITDSMSCLGDFHAALRAATRGDRFKANRALMQDLMAPSFLHLVMGPTVLILTRRAYARRWG